MVISDLLPFKSVDVLMKRSNDGVSSVIFLQHVDRHALHLRPIFRQANLMSEHFDFRPQLQQPTKRSLAFRFFVGGDLLRDGTVRASNANALA